MSKKYVVKRKINKKNIFFLLTLIILIMFLLTSFIKNLFFKEESVLANEPNKNNLTTEFNDNNEEQPILDKDENKDEVDDIKKTHFKIVLDASYGGSEGGSKGYNGIIQKNINLDLTLKIKDFLERYDDIDVILTRKDDSTVSIEERVNIINNSGADFVISIMQNTEGSGNVSGVESYILPKGNDKSNATLGYILQQSMIMYIDTKDRGVLARNMEILSKSNIPGAVVNTGFITNKKEGLNLASDKYQLRMAEGISQGILSYIDRYLKE